MQKIVIKKLIWDKWNSNHIIKHQLSIEEVEESLQDKYVIFIQGHSNRFMSLGRSKKRLITVVLQKQKNRTEYYVVTARDMAKKERVIYRIEKSKKEGKNV